MVLFLLLLYGILHLIHWLCEVPNYCVYLSTKIFQISNHSIVVEMVLITLLQLPLKVIWLYALILYLDIPNVETGSILNSNNNIGSIYIYSILFFGKCHYIIDVSDILTQYLPQNIHSCDFIESIPSSNTSIILPNWTCSDFNYTVFDFSRFTNVESIEIGDDSFFSVRTFSIDRMNKLQTLKIGQKSFTSQKHYGAVYRDKSFHILNCASLESIEIGEHSFGDFGGEFELSNLPSLQLLKIGGEGSDSGNLYYVNPIIRGIG